MDKEKRLTISFTQEMQQRLDKAKEKHYRNDSTEQMLCDLIKRGLDYSSKEKKKGFIDVK